MFQLNTENKLPQSIKWYALVEMVLLFLLFSLPFIFFGKNIWFSIFCFPFIFFGLPIWTYSVVSLKFTSFIITEDNITTNSGILFKNSKTISFDRIQNSNTSRGPLSGLFNLSKLNIWTASPSQIRIERGKSDNKPEQFLWLKTGDANWLKDFISKKK